MTLANQLRLRRLLPNNYPRYVRVYDNGGESADRYTVVFTGKYNSIGRSRGSSRADVAYWHIGMSENPFHPQGVCLWDSHTRIIDLGKDSFPPKIGAKCHLGKRIQWHQLPEECQKAALHAYRELWNLSS